MDISNRDKKRKRLFFFLCAGLTLLVTAGFTITDYFERDPVEFLIDIVIGIILIACIVAIIKYEADRVVYRLGLALISVCFSYLVSIGSGEGTVLFWVPIIPLMFLFFLGRSEGLLGSGLLFIVLCFLLINPFSLEIYAYDLGTSIRFLSMFTFLTIIASGLESSRQQFSELLLDEHKKLLVEKQNLEKALRDVKTLSGLLPICASCKRIRDDKGYWKQVESYIREHSSAKFSHGICPECFKKLYPEYKDLMEEQK